MQFILFDHAITSQINQKFAFIYFGQYPPVNRQKLSIIHKEPAVVTVSRTVTGSTWFIEFLGFIWLGILEKSIEKACA
jgi:hypothetical protein